jgi:hypothetical protein
MKVERWLSVVWDKSMDGTDTQWYGPYAMEHIARHCFDDGTGLVRSGLAIKVTVDVTPGGIRFIGVEASEGVGE